MYSFALNSFELQPSGTANFSEINNVSLHMNLENNISMQK